MQSHSKIRYNKVKILISALIIILIISRIVLPSILLKKTNKYLSEFSPAYYLHINDLDISILRMAYRFEEVEAKIKSSKQKFLSIESVDVSIAWREIFKGRILTEIKAEKLELLIIKNIKKISTPKKEATDIKSTLFPVKIEKFDIVDSSITFEEYASFSDETHLKISDINGRITNINPTEKFPISFYNLTAKLIDKNAIFKLVGEMNLMQKPIAWNMDAEVRDFRLNSLNPYLKRHLPLTFTKGTADVYSEIKSEKGKMVGYVKPFLREIDVVANKEHFTGIKHFGIEIVTALVNLILRESKTKSVATILEFEFDKKFKMKTGKGISRAVEHGFQQQLSPGIDDRYNIN